MDFNLEAAREELDNFENETNSVSPLLESYLQVIAKTGNTLFPWSLLQPLLRRKMELVLSEFMKSCPPENIPALPNTEAFDFDSVKINLLGAVDAFPSAPFTIQRLCELIVNPKKHYSRTDKYMRGLEKNLLVVSTIESLAGESNSRNQIPLVNGGLNNSADGYEDSTGTDNEASMCSTSPPNGTVLENFATVFPSATRIAAPSNNIQVPVISDSNDFLPTECVEDFNYDISDNISTDANEMMSSSVTDVFMSNSVNTDSSLLTSPDAATDSSSLSEVSEDNSDASLDSDTVSDDNSSGSKTNDDDTISNAADDIISNAADDMISNAADDTISNATDDTISNATDDIISNATDDIISNATDDTSIVSDANDSSVSVIHQISVIDSVSNLEEIRNLDSHDEKNAKESLSEENKDFVDNVETFSSVLATPYDTCSNSDSNVSFTNTVPETELLKSDPLNVNDDNLLSKNCEEEPNPKRRKLDTDDSVNDDQNIENCISDDVPEDEHEKINEVDMEEPDSSDSNKEIMDEVVKSDEDDFVSETVETNNAEIENDDNEESTSTVKDFDSNSNKISSTDSVESLTVPDICND